MKLKDSFISYDSDGTQILVDTGSQFAGLIRSNKTSAFIVDLLRNDTTEDEIVNALYEKYDAPEDVIRKDVQNIISELNSVGAIDE